MFGDLSTCHLVGAYGRTYNSKKSFLADWNAGKDFYALPDGFVCNRRDYEKEKINKVQVRYGKRLEKTTTLDYRPSVHNWGATREKPVWYKNDQRV